MTDTYPFDPPAEYQIDINPPSVYSRYTKITGMLTTFWSADKIDDLIEDYGEKQFFAALEKAKEYGKHGNWNYITAILRNGKNEADQPDQAKNDLNAWAERMTVNASQ